MRGRRHELAQDVDGRQGCRVVHQRQIDELLDRPAAQQRPDAVVFAPHVVLGRMGRPFDADMPEVVETDSDRAAALIEGRVDIDAQARNDGLLDRRRGALRQRRQSLLGDRQPAGQEFAFGPVELEGKDQVAPALPAILRQQRRPEIEIGEGRGIGRRGLGALAGDQVEPGQLFALVARGDQGGAAIHLIDDLEDRPLAFLGWRLRRQQPADPQMKLGAQGFRGQRIGGLLDPAVHELVGAVQAFDQFLADRRPQRRMNRAPPRPAGRSKAWSFRPYCRGRPSAAAPAAFRPAGGPACRP